MPTPFPGMDPYLEGSLWTTLHFSLSAEIVRQLAPQLPAHYLILPTERFVVEIPEGITVTTANVYPDVGISETQPPVAYPVAAPTIAPAPLRLATVVPTVVPHVTLEIRDTANRRLVTAIEVLSPTNKRGNGREEYLAKREHLLLSRAHLLEIDLLRQGQRVPMQQPLPAATYFIFLSRAQSRPMSEVWPIALNQPLPIVPIPLLPGDADIPLDLQQTFASVYDLLHYERAIDYTQPPEVPLTQAESVWVEAWLRA